MTTDNDIIKIYLIVTKAKREVEYLPSFGDKLSKRYDKTLNYKI